MKISEAWDKQHPLLYLLMPIAYLFRGIVYLRRCCYRLGFKKVVKFSVPVIVVGNITVGGTGKTPLVAWLANFLKELDYKPGIVSRGYGATSKKFPLFVDKHSDVTLVGDEPFLLAQMTQCPMVVDPDRVAAVSALLAKTNCDIVISDDGLQHYALSRTIEIAVVDGRRRFGNKLCLPAGPLREPISRLQEVDFIVTNGEAENLEYQMRIIPQDLHSLIDPKLTQTLSNLQGRMIHAVAGIGNPSRFFYQLRELGLSIIEHAFPDHHHFTLQDINFDDAPVIMTEKDAVKCIKFADYRHWYMPIGVDIDEAFKQELTRKLSKESVCVSC